MVFVEDFVTSNNSDYNVTNSQFYLVQDAIEVEDNETVTGANGDGGQVDMQEQSANESDEIILIDDDSVVIGDDIYTDCDDTTEYDANDESYIPPANLDVDVNTRPHTRANPAYIVMSGANEPHTVGQAMATDDADKWKDAMNDEFQSLIANGTWTLTELPAGRKAINSRWVFKTKCDSNGNVERHKARLVAKGCNQKKGIDFEETFSPVVLFGSIRYLIAMAAKHGLMIDQMDAVTAF